MASAGVPLTISPEFFDSAFPFHLAFDRDLLISQMGTVLRRIYPQMECGRPLTEYFLIRDPAPARNFDEIAQQNKRLFVMVGLRNRIVLRGQMVLSQDKALLIFLCTPWMADMEAARQLGVSRSTLYRKSKGNCDPFL